MMRYLRVMETVKMTASAETALAAPYVRRNVIAPWPHMMRTRQSEEYWG